MIFEILGSRDNTRMMKLGCTITGIGTMIL